MLDCWLQPGPHLLHKNYWIGGHTSPKNSIQSHTAIRFLLPFHIFLFLLIIVFSLPGSAGIRCICLLQNLIPLKRFTDFSDCHLANDFDLVRLKAPASCVSDNRSNSIRHWCNVGRIISSIQVRSHLVYEGLHQLHCLSLCFCSSRCNRLPCHLHQLRPTRINSVSQLRCEVHHLVRARQDASHRLGCRTHKVKELLPRLPQTLQPSSSPH
mmetsp:Transcript_114932/g.263939  ORF Transcript_114932/g.263939 Transcript_114932/m.263939 type:complete len:211 (-) Transcript_114932:2078-2710(-)